MLLLLRHGETAMNAGRRLQGRVDSALTERGRGQALAQGRLIASLGADRGPGRLLTSPLGRARATAAIVAREAGLPEPEVDERLTEVSFGRWEGLTLEEAAALDPAVPFESARLAWAAGSPGGESYADADARARGWLAANDGSHAAAVTHGVFASLLIGAYAGLTRDEALRLHVPNDALYGLSHGCVQRLDPAGAELD